MSTPNPGFLEKLEQDAEQFFDHMKEQVHHAIHPDETTDAAPSSTEPAPNVIAADAVAASAVESSATAPAAVSTGDQTDSGSAPVAASVAAGPGEDPNVAVSPVAASSTSEAPSATNVSSDAGASQTGASTPAEAPVPQTFEQAVEARFLHIERAFMQLPASLHAVMSGGSMEAEDFAKAVLAHVFTHI